MAWKNEEDKKEYYRKYFQKNKRKILEQRREYQKIYQKKYQKENKEKIKENRNWENRRLWCKKYYALNNVKIKKHKKSKKEILKQKSDYRRNYLKNNPTARISGRLRVLLLKALSKYTNTGKYQCSKKYGIDYEKIIEHLKPFPEDLSKYHIDHIIPLCSFDLTNPEEIKKAFAVENHQWLLSSENQSKGGRY